MPSPLPFASTSDPRLDVVVGHFLRESRLQPEWAGTIRDLATGRTDARALRCCGSGCRPCVQDLLRCTASTLKAMQDPAELERIQRRRHGPRSLAGRLLRGVARRLLG